jgi:hypothetical protein
MVGDAAAAKGLWRIAAKAGYFTQMKREAGLRQGRNPG